MSTEGARGARHTGEGAEPVPLGAGVPPAPRAAPEAPHVPLVVWLHTPRPGARPGIWRLGHVPRPPEDPRRLGDRELHGGAVLALLAGMVVWSLYDNRYLPVVLWPLDWLGRQPWGDTAVGMTLVYLYEPLFVCLLVYVFGRIGHGPALWRRWRPALVRLWCGREDVEPLRRGQTVRALVAAVVAVEVWRLSFAGVWMLKPLDAVVPPPDVHTVPYVIAYNIYYLLYTALLLALAARAGDWRVVWRRYPSRLPGRAAVAASPEESTALARLADWTELREAGERQAADRLAGEARSGAMSDLDYARIAHAWQAVRARPTELTAFAEAALTQGAGAFVHPSGQRDLAVRTAQHDLLTRQVRLGHAPDDERNPYQHRGTDLALDPAVLGTSLLAVGPPGCGKTGRVVRPVAEALSLQALTGQAAVVVVGTARSGLGPDDAFDVIVRVGDAAGGGRRHRLDLYGGAAGTDEAAALLAEALVGDTDTEPRAATAVLAQLIGPFHTAYGHFPGVPELRAMLDGAPALLATLREALGEAGAWHQQRELDARARQAGRPDDLAPVLADRLGLLDRAGFSPDTEAGHVPLFSLRALESPLRVRVDLPGAGHGEACRIVTRLLLAQFTTTAVNRPDRTLFACLVLDDATAAVTRGTVRGLAQLRQANAGAVLALRTLDDVPEPLRAGLLGAVGCRMAFSGITTWDAEHFTRAWGTEWTEDTETTRTPDRSGGTVRRLARGVRRLFTGRDTTTEAVTVRRVERERWSPSELAHRVPPRHAVVSLTTVSGEAAPPVLVRLG